MKNTSDSIRQGDATAKSVVDGDQLLELRNVTTNYRGVNILKNVSIGVEQGVTVVLGPNGAGKTTLFRTASGILEPDVGTVTVGGVDIYADPAAKAAVNYLPHRPVLNKRLSVRRNLQFWGRVQGMAGPRIDERIAEIASQLQFEDLLNREVKLLSRGQIQRITIGQALLSDPTILLLDEATTGLDPNAAQNLRNYLTKIGERHAVVYATHDLAVANELADHAVVLSDGCVKFDDTYDVVRNRYHGTQRVGFRTGDERASELLAQEGFDPERQGAYWVIETDGSVDTSKLSALLTKHGVNLTEVSMMDNAMEALYQNLNQGGDHD